MENKINMDASIVITIYRWNYSRTYTYDAGFTRYGIYDTMEKAKAVMMAGFGAEEATIDLKIKSCDYRGVIRIVKLKNDNKTSPPNDNTPITRQLAIQKILYSGV